MVACDYEGGMKPPTLDANSPIHKLPILTQIPTHAPNVPPPTGRRKPAHVVVDMNSTSEAMPLTLTRKVSCAR